MATVNLNPVENYSQPTLTLPSSGGWHVNCVDYQVTTKDVNWNQDQTKRLNEFQAAKNLGGVNYVALGVPYNSTSKYTNYVADARTKGFKIWFRSHWDAWQGDNSIGGVTSINRSSNTATVVTSTAHGMVTGNTVVIADAVETDYNGEYTITVTDTTTFTYTVSNTPSTPATGTILWRYGRQTYLDKTYDFIVDNPTLFADGDLFTTCVEANNADGGSKNWTFRSTGKSSGSFDFAKYNRFQRDQVTYANAAFLVIGKSVSTFALSHSLSLCDLNGQVLDSTDGGNSNGFDDADMVNYCGGIVCIDHYMSDAYRYSTDPSYWSRYSDDLDKLHVSFPNCKIMIGEWGYHTITSVSGGEKHGMFEKIVDVLRSKDYIWGVSFWTHMGSNTASIWVDSSGTITPGATNVSNAISRAFNTGNSSYGPRARA